MGEETGIKTGGGEGKIGEKGEGRRENEGGG